MNHRRTAGLRANSTVLLLVALCRCGGSPAAPPVEIPLPSLDAAESRVRQEVTQNYEWVFEKPRDGDLWGRYAMVLDAHGFAESAKSAYRRAHAQQPDDFRWPYFLAALFDSSEPETAVEWYTRALALDPEYAPAHIRMANTLEKLARQEEARQHYSTATELDSGNVFGPLGLGRIALRRGELATAVTHLERAYDLNPEIHAVVSSLAQAYHRSGDVELALRRAAQARDLPRITYQPDSRRAAIKGAAVDVRSFMRRSQTHLDVGRPAEALEELKQAIELSPDFADAHFAAAEVYVRLGDFEAAAAAAERGLELTPERSGGRALLARSLARLGRLEAAEKAARAALDEDPTDGNMHLLLGKLMAQRGRPQEAIEHLRRAVRTRPQDTAWGLLLASVLAEAGRLDEARAELSRILDLGVQGPDEAQAWTELGFLDLAGKDPAAAVLAFDRGLALGNPDALPGLVQALILSAGPEAATRRLQQHLETRPSDTAARILLADFLAAAGRLEEAGGEILQVIDQEPRNSEAWIQLGYIRLRRRQTPQAVIAFERALALTSDPVVKEEARRGLAQAQRSP